MSQSTEAEAASKQQMHADTNSSNEKPIADASARKFQLQINDEQQKQTKNQTVNVENDNFNHQGQENSANDHEQQTINAETGQLDPKQKSQQHQQKLLN